MVNKIADFLNIKIISNNFIFLNLWTFLHILTGILLFKFLPAQYNTYFIMILLLIAYEIIEIYFVSKKMIFRRERKLDIFYDVLAGSIGYHIARIGLWFL